MAAISPGTDFSSLPHPKVWVRRWLWQFWPGDLYWGGPLDWLFWRRVR